MFWYVWLCLTAMFMQQSVTATDKINISYTLWLDPKVSKSASITLTANTNDTFYHIMKMAEAQDTTFKFEADDTKWGHYIKKISGIEEDAVKNIYWMIYLLPSSPNPNAKPDNNLLSPVGVDSIKVKKGTYYLFWYNHIPLNKKCNDLK